MIRDTRKNILMILGWIGVALFAIAPFAIIIAFMIWDAHKSCDTFALINPDFDIMWVGGEGCMIKYNGLFIHVDDVVNVLGGR